MADRLGCTLGWACMQQADLRRLHSGLHEVGTSGESDCWVWGLHAERPTGASRQVRGRRCKVVSLLQWQCSRPWLRYGRSIAHPQQIPCFQSTPLSSICWAWAIGSLT